MRSRPRQRAKNPQRATREITGVGLIRSIIVSVNNIFDFVNDMDRLLDGRNGRATLWTGMTR